MSQDTSSTKVVGLIIGIVISLIFIAYFLPVGFTAFFNANWTTDITGLDANIANMIVTVIPIIVILGIVVTLLGVMKIRSSN